MIQAAEQQLYSVKELVSILSLSRATIWRQVNLGHIPEPVKIGGSTRWRKSDIDKLVQALGQDGNDDPDPDPEGGLVGAPDPNPKDDPDVALRAEADLAHGLAEDGYAA
jgi:prophage regulatory protein